MPIHIHVGLSQAGKWRAAGAGQAEAVRSGGLPSLEGMGGPIGELHENPTVLKMSPPGVGSSDPARTATAACGHEISCTLSFATVKDSE